MPSLLLLFSLLVFSGSPVHAAEKLAEWAAKMDVVETQQKILNLIFPGQIGSDAYYRTSAPSGRRFFSKGGFWVRVGGDVVWSGVERPVQIPFLVVSVLSYQDPVKEPISSVSYVLYDTQRKPTALSAGYAAHERVQGVYLPKLKKSFILLVASSGGKAASSRQWTASLFPLTPRGAGDRPKPVWTSPMSARNFQIGFDSLGGATEQLLLRTVKSGSTVEYSSFQWEGDRFELYSFTSETRLKSLPDAVWQYGASH